MGVPINDSVVTFGAGEVMQDRDQGVYGNRCLQLTACNPLKDVHLCVHAIYRHGTSVMVRDSCPTTVGRIQMPG